MINIYYHKETAQFDALLHLNQAYCSLEDITQCQAFSEYEFNIVYNGDKTKLDKSAPVIIPIDYQSIPLSADNREGIAYVSALGEKVRNLIKEIAEFLDGFNVVVLIYTSTEPFFYDSACYIDLLAKQYPQIKFVVSGSGTTDCNYPHHKDAMLSNDNVFFITKSWYIDKVHYNKFILDGGETRHFLETETTPPASTPDYITCSNTFILTMRNPRPHRLIMSTLIENNAEPSTILDYTRYSRAWSLQSWHLNNIFSNPESKEEHPYQVELLSDAIKGVLDERLPSDFIERMMQGLYFPPHKLDMNGIQDRGFPAKWLYDNINVAVVASGEHGGYGYIDEKQLIPIFYKKPFICFGSKGVNEELEKIGFDVYRRVFDLSYASKDSLYDRVEGCYALINDIATWNKDKKHTVFTVVGNRIAEKNFRNFETCKFRILGNNAFFKELIDACD